MKQALNTSNIRRETLDGTEYVVAPTTLLKPMYLNVPGSWSVNEAYLPEREAKESIPSWNGTPLTLNHPTQNGAGTTANSPEMHAKTAIGRVFNAQWENNELKAEAWFNVDKIRGMGGMAENALENVLEGQAVNVSTGYRASKLPSGEYDGETHSAVQGNLKPDHLAVLPNQQGKCSVDGGCGVGEPVANSMIYTNVANQQFEEGDLVRWSTSASPGTGRVNTVVTEPGETVTAEGADVTREATDEEAAYKLDNWNGDEFETGTVVKSASEILGSWDDAPDEVMNMEIPDEFRFDNPGEAMAKAQDMGLEAIHTHGDGDNTVFMPGESHDALVSEVEGMAENVLSEARTPTYDGTETQSWADVSKDLMDWVDALGVDAETVADMSQAQKQTVAEHTLLGDPDADSWGELRFFPVVNPNTQNLNRGALVAVLSGRGAQADIPESSLESARSVAESLLDEEFESDNSGHMDEEMSENALYTMYSALKDMFKNSTANEGAESSADDTPNMSDKTQELVDNHGFKADNLPDEGTDCFDAIYNRFVGEEGTDTETTTENAENVKEITESELEELIANRVDERLEERQTETQKEQLASTIAANSTDYESTEEVLEDFPTTAALNTKKKDVVGNTPDFSGSVGANAQPATNTEDADDLTMFGSDA